jgi:predicted DNA binding CopG/RHH family protein
LKSIQQQVENMLKNVDKTGLTTNDELQLQQALNAVNCLLDGIAE